jgi:hypothetical protein
MKIFFLWLQLKIIRFFGGEKEIVKIKEIEVPVPSFRPEEFSVEDWEPLSKSHIDFPSWFRWIEHEMNLVEAQLLSQEPSEETMGKRFLLQGQLIALNKAISVPETAIRLLTEAKAKKEGLILNNLGQGERT